ncbi:MAG: hypothetical protein M1834_001134 [Cirrosporium novae-zelandiae]|nr:MAG: hypothetical protein M1834_001134 [Cirrosporium novae-zelandiae]
MGPIARLIGSGIGLVQEARAANKAKSPSAEPNSDDRFGEDEAAASSSRAPPPPRPSIDPIEKHDSKDGYSDDSDGPFNDDEAYWDLDEAIEGSRESLPSYEQSQASDDVDSMIRSFVAHHPAPAYSSTTRLPLPVIIPQRRPRNKTRGFVHAYAPVLADCGIDQQTFLDFLVTFHKASQASPYIEVINLAAMGLGFVPSISTQVTSAVLQIVAGTAKAVQSRYRTNSFLDKMNDQLFKPHGLFCMIMTFKPDKPNSLCEEIDINKLVVKTMTPASSAMREKMKSLRMASGETRGELQLPEAAPLIFPKLDQLADEAGADQAKQNKFKQSTAFVSDYLDRRAQATYNAQNPNSILAVQQPQQFASRYSDPNHPASSGSLISLVTGGHVNPMAARQSRRAAKHERKDQKRARYGRDPVSRGPNGRKQTMIRKALTQNVLYLMVVNMPTDEEIAEARTFLG